MNRYQIKYDDYIGYKWEDEQRLERTAIYQARTATQALRKFYEAHPLYAINSIRRIGEKEQVNIEYERG
jgi:hypothetical protein